MTNVNINGVPIQVGNIRIPLANPHRFYYTLAKVDHRLTKQRQSQLSAAARQARPARRYQQPPFWSQWSGAQAIYGQNHALSHTRNFGTRFINEFRAAYIRRNLDFPENDPVSPTIAITSYFTIGGDPNFPQGRIQNTYQFQNVATSIQGRHSFKFGVDIRRNQLFNRSGFDSKGTWTFSNLADFINNSGFDLDQAVNESTFDARQTNQYYFFRMTSRPHATSLSTWVCAMNIRVCPSDSSAPPPMKSLAAGVPRDTKPDKNNWAPRFGFAYSPSCFERFPGQDVWTGRSVVPGRIRNGLRCALLQHPDGQREQLSPRCNQHHNQPRGSISLHWRRKMATIPPFNPLLAFVNTPSDTQNPTVHFWSLSFQRQFKSSYIFEWVTPATVPITESGRARVTFPS